METHREPKHQQKKRSRDWGVDVAAIAGSLVHEIKNPLSTLNINAQLLLEDWKDAEKPRELRTVRRLKVMISELERLERILQSFLRFTERHELSLQPSSLNSLLEEVVELVGAQLAQGAIQLRLWLDPGLKVFPFDPDLMRQVVLNLILNARHAMAGKGGELILRTRTVARDGHPWAVCEVIDTGHGVPPHLREKIFDLYFSTRKDGSGLGLATSKRITEEHGGFIELETEEGKGSQFSVFLPMEPVQR
ncbi:MAG: two-component sensor histidine kinase [Planctomycetes bacterium]|nr:two-component sensor histidine kinase [Planctomycetota bacterium]